MYAFHDDPALVHDVLTHLTELWLALFEEVLGDTDVDYAYWWEDMSFKSGSMVSPRIFAEFLAPVYRRINGFLREHGIDVVLLDTDGNVWDLIPQFLAVGVTGLYPFEVRAGMDVAEVRARYPRLQMLGGIDKGALVAGPEAIDREIARVAPVIRTGGYVPGVDHYVHPDVPWEHFCTTAGGWRGAVESTLPGVTPSATRETREGPVHRPSEGDGPAQASADAGYGHTTPRCTPTRHEAANCLPNPLTIRPTCDMHHIGVLSAPLPPPPESGVAPLLFHRPLSSFGFRHPTGVPSQHQASRHRIPARLEDAAGPASPSARERSRR